MISFTDLQGLIGDSFFGGDSGIAGVVMFAFVMAIIFAVFGRSNMAIPFALMLPTTLVFTAMNILPQELTILMVIVSVIGIAMTMRDKVI